MNEYAMVEFYKALEEHRGERPKRWVPTYTEEKGWHIAPLSDEKQAVVDAQARVKARSDPPAP